MKALLAIVLLAPDWQLANVSTLPRDDVYNDVRVLPSGAVWTVGHGVVNGRSRGLVKRLSGSSVKTLPPLTGEFATLAATSDKNVWAFGLNRAVRWNGGAWSSWSLPAFRATDAEAVSAKNIWAVGGPTSRHWTGSSWKKVAVPGTATAIDSAKGSVWAAGAKGLRPAVFRLRGGKWVSQTLPKITLPSTDASAYFLSVAVLGSANVWAVGAVTWEGANEEGDDETYSRPLAMHWNGVKWTVRYPSAKSQPYTEVEPDGKGGVWVAEGSWNPKLWQVRGGTWSSARLGGKSGYDSALHALARRPGTSTVWGAGFITPQGDPDDPSANAALWRVP